MSREQIPGGNELQILRTLVQETPPQDYSRLIKKAEKVTVWGRVYQAELSYGWELGGKGPLNEEKMQEVLRQVLTGVVLFDLGGGGKGAFLKFLNKRNIHPKGYVSVDKYSEPTGPEIGSVGNSPVFELPGGVMIRSDALALISRCPNGSLRAISINSMNDEVINYEKYHEVLAQEIIRTLALGGVFIGNDTPVIKFLLQSEKMELVYEFDPLQEAFPRRKTRPSERKDVIHHVVLRKIKD